MLNVSGLSKSFSIGALGIRKIAVFKDISFSLGRGETLGITGESGCGKTTLARCVLGLIPYDSGTVWFKGIDISKLTLSEKRETRKRMQLVAQHPYSALDPRMIIEKSLIEPLRIHGLRSKNEEKETIEYLLDIVELHPEILSRYPHEVSGGQLQRVVIARALSLNPSFIVLDEPTSMLDVSVQANILHLLKRLQRELTISYLFISHDREVVRFMGGEVMEMRPKTGNGNR